MNTVIISEQNAARQQRRPSILSPSVHAIVLFATLLFLGSTGRVPAQPQPLENLLYSAGTTIADAQNRQWAYLLWQASTPDMIKDRGFAIYRKAGDANSPALYERKSVSRLTMDPNVISVLINRAVNLGENPALLEERLDNLFQKLMPPSGATLADKVSVVIRSSLGDLEHYRNLILLSRVHPAITLCLGNGFADQVPPAGQFTYEVRQYDEAKQQDIAVVGRVSVTAGAPTVLPAPGAPVQVPDVPVSSAKGDLNAKFRWIMPDALRRLSLMGYGFNLYRVTTNYALSHNYHNVAPGLGVLAQLAHQYANNPSNPPVKLVNKSPILKSKDFTVAEVGNFNTNSPGGDDKTYFVHDDNDRYKPDHTPFRNGEQFYYFVAARDILGRDGFTSPGTMVTMCDRLPPDSPRGITVENDYSKQPNQPPVQVLKVSWLQNTNTPMETNVAYFVYRWTNHSDYLKDTLNPVMHPNLVGVVPHAAGAIRREILDQGPGSPHMPEDAGKTFWYTVRALDNGACGGNFSAHSGPIFGVLRDRTGPNAPGGSVIITCCQPVVTGPTNQDLTLLGGDASKAYFRPSCDRDNASIEWAEFYAFNTQPSNLIHRVTYQGTLGRASAEFAWPRSLLLNTQVTFYCRVGMSGGKVSGFRSGAASPPTVGVIRHVVFKASTDCDRVFVGTTPDDRCNRHEPNPPGNSGTNDCVELLIGFAEGTREIKVYKRVDLGPLMMIEQAKATNSGILMKDCTPIANASDVCYFAQAFDEHGNASALVPIGSCIDVGGSTEIAKPILAPLSPVGSSGSPEMEVTWFCPPYGVERFEVSIAVEGNAVTPTQITTNLSDKVRLDQDVDFKISSKSLKDDFSVYHTKVIGPTFGGGGAKFKLTASIELGKTYYVYVRAIGKDGASGDRSNAEDFTWSPPSTPGPQVPWPDRPLPAVQAPFNAELIAAVLPTDIYPVGIRLGTQIPVVGTPTNGNTMIPGFTNPLNYVFAKKDGSTVLPLAVYRYQVANANFPTVSGDLTQVTPLMEKIAYQQTTVGQFGQVTIIRDPFIGVYRNSKSPLTEPGYDMFLLDTQPIINGARYGYLLVRFGANREIEEVIPMNEVEL
jgi:hypothetical protein